MRDTGFMYVCTVGKLLSLGSGNGAVALASAAVNALFGVNNIQSIALCNSVNGAVFLANSAGNALIGNLVSHNNDPPSRITDSRLAVL